MYSTNETIDVLEKMSIKKKNYAFLPGVPGGHVNNDALACSGSGKNSLCYQPHCIWIFDGIHRVTVKAIRKGALSIHFSGIAKRKF